MKSLVINISTERYQNGKLTKVAGTLHIPEQGHCVFVIRPANRISYFYQLHVKGAHSIQISNFEKMIEEEWQDRTMIKWIGTHAQGMLDLALYGKCEQVYEK